MKETSRGFSTNLVIVITVLMALAWLGESVNPSWRGTASAESEREVVSPSYGRGFPPAYYQTTTVTEPIFPIKENEQLKSSQFKKVEEVDVVAISHTVDDLVEFEIGDAEPDIPYLIDQLYRYYERGSHVVELQKMLGMEQIDGIYGPKTRKAHMLWFGSTTEALEHFNGRADWYLETNEEEPADEYLGNYWEDRPTLQELVNQYFLPNDRELALRIAFCESSILPHHTDNDAVSSALAVGAFQHLARYWKLRSAAAGFEGWDIYDLKAQVGVASHLFYNSGRHHWNPSKACWGHLR